MKKYKVKADWIGLKNARTARKNQVIDENQLPSSHSIKDLVKQNILEQYNEPKIQEKEDKEKPLSGMTVAELLEFAEHNKINITSKNKADILTEIELTLEQAKKEDKEKPQ